MPNGTRLTAMLANQGIVEALGGRRVVKAATIDELRKRLRTGLPYAAFGTLAAGLGLDAAQLAIVLDLSLRTLARRKAARRFRPDESDRIARLARVVAHARDVFGERDKLVAWLHSPNRVLGNEPPIQRLGTDLGAHTVDDLLLRIAHGVHS